MGAAVTGIIAFLCIIGGMVVGMLMRSVLPVNHLSGDSKDTVRISSGMIATLTALVLSLLVTSAKNKFDDMNDTLAQSSSKIIMLDRNLAQYGSETQAIREQLRSTVAAWVTASWHIDKTAMDEMSVFEKSPATMEIVGNKLRELVPQNDSQREFQSDSLKICKELVQTRWLEIEKAQTSLPKVFLVMLLFWLAMLFGSFGLFAPPNKTVLVALVVCAISVASAIFIIEEMNKPLSGIVKVSNATLVKAVENIGK